MARRSALSRDPKPDAKAAPKREERPAPRPEPKPAPKATPEARPAPRPETQAKPQAKKDEPLTAPARPENKAIFDGMSPEQQQRYLRIRRNKGLEAANKWMGKVTGKTPTGPGGRARTDAEKKGATPPPVTTQPTGPANEPAPGVPFEQLTPEEQMGEMADVGGNIYNRMGNFATEFDPRTFQSDYQPVFTEEMEKARQNVLGQFERRNKQQFDTQRLNVQQQIAERGLDPASPAAQELMRQQNERETLANQEAMSAAESAAQGVQQQMYSQATGTALLPGQVMQPFMDPIMAQYAQAGQMNQLQFGQAGTMDQLRFRAEQDMALQRLQGQQQLAAIKATPRGGGGGGGGAPADPYAAFNQYMAGNIMSGYNQAPAKPNMASSFAGGFAQGTGTAITNQFLKK
jgi:hypothetical protein